ncbi:MAG: extracellular solute-binding protein [Propionivibrio sp.]
MNSKFSGGFSRRHFLASTVVLGAAMWTGRVRAADMFGPPPMPLPAADGPLRWLDSGDQKAVFFKEFFANYGKARGVEVVYDGLPWNEIATVLPLGIRNGTAPDAFALPINMPPSIAVAQGWVQPLDDLIPDFANWKAGFPAGSFIEGVNVVKGKTYGLPYTSDRRCSALLLFGKKAMALTEFDPGPDSPLTWEQFRAAANQIMTKSKGRVPGFVIGGAQVPRWSQVTLALAQRAGATCGNTSFSTGLNYKTGEIVVDSDEFVGAIELLLAMNADGSVFPGTLSLNAPQARAFTAQDQAGMILQGPWNIPIWEGKNPEFDFSFCATPAPEGANGKVYVDTLPAAPNMMYVNAAAKNPKIAADVFRIMGTIEGQTAWANVVGASDPAIFPKAAELATLSQRNKAVMALQADMIRAAPVPFSKKSGFVAVARLYKEPTQNLAQTVQGLFAGQLGGVKETLSKLKGEMNKSLDTAIAAAKAEGADVDRSDLVFADWDPMVDYG